MAYTDDEYEIFSRQFILKALSDKNGTGNGLTLGLCVAFIGLAVDQVIRTWATDRKKLLGLD